MLYSNKLYPKGPLFCFLGEFEDECPSVLEKCEKIIVHYGEFEDD
jgi:hypothetical protein